MYVYNRLTCLSASRDSKSSGNTDISRSFEFFLILSFKTLMRRAVPNTVNSWQRNRKEYHTCNSLCAMLLVAELISIKYNVGQPDGSTTIN